MLKAEKIAHTSLTHFAMLLMLREYFSHHIISVPAIFCISFRLSFIVEYYAIVYKVIRFC
jgi:hypothetical protein